MIVAIPIFTYLLDQLFKPFGYYVMRHDATCATALVIFFVIRW